MKKNILLINIIIFSILLIGCNKQNNNTSSNTTSNDIITSIDNSSIVDNDYIKIDDATKLFKTYDSVLEYNFEVEFACSTVYKRQHVATWSTDYQYQGRNIQLTYEANGAYYIDYYVEDPSTDTYMYYIDMGGTKEYQLIDGENEYYFQFVSQIDKLDISNIEWEDSFLVNETTKTLIPVDNAALNENAKHIFGDKANEYWEKLEISYDNKYITKISAISIYRETTYYYTIDISNHTWIDFELPTVTKDYVGNQPYYKNEVYEGKTLSTEQINAIEFLDNGYDANYSVTTLWEQVILGEMTGANVTTYSKYADGQAEYRYTDVQTNLTYTDYIIETSQGQFTYYKDNANGTHSPLYSGTSEYQEAIGNYALDQVNLSLLDASDFIYNEAKGYLMPKDKKTEEKLVKSIFGYSEYYYGLHIYLKDNVISKLETSLYMESGTNIASYKKTYTITDIGSTTIVYPSDVIHN